MDHVDRARLAEHCGSRDDSLRWDLSQGKQCEAIQVDDMDPQGRGWKEKPDKLFEDLGVRKVQVKLKDGPLRCVNRQVADTDRALMVVSEVVDMRYDVFILRSSSV